MILNKFKNYFNKFLSSKFIFYSNIDKPKGNILFVDRERADTGIANSILALAVSKKYKMNVLILTDSKLDSTIMKIYRQLGFTNFLIGVSQYQKIKYFNTFLYSIFLSLIGIFNIYKKGFIWFINKYSINNVLIGDLIYDTNIRILNRFQNPKIDLYFIKILIKSTFRTLIIKNHFKKYNIKKVIVGTEVYSFNSGIALRLAVYNKNIKNYTIVGNHIGDLQILNYKKEYIDYGPDNIKKDKELNKKFNELKINFKKIEKFYIKRKKLKTENIYTRLDFKKANKISNYGKKFLKKFIKKKGKIILYASHAFSDSVHMLGTRFAFKDYYEQMIETLNYIKKNDKKNIWIFRSHPASLLLNEEKIFKSIITKTNQKNIIFCPSNVPINSLYKICECVVTGRGTIGLEFACEGKPVVLAGHAPYSNFGISQECKSKKQYFKSLENINNLKKLNMKKIKIAKKILFFYESGLFSRNQILINNFHNDKIGKNFFKNYPGAPLEYLFKIACNYLASDINKSKIFQKIVSIV